MGGGRKDLFGAAKQMRSDNKRMSPAVQSRPTDFLTVSTSHVPAMPLWLNVMFLGWMCSSVSVSAHPCIKPIPWILLTDIRPLFRCFPAGFAVRLIPETQCNYGSLIGHEWWSLVALDPQWSICIFWAGIHAGGSRVPFWR